MVRVGRWRVPTWWGPHLISFLEQVSKYSTHQDFSRDTPVLNHRSEQELQNLLHPLDLTYDVAAEMILVRT